MSSTPTPTVAQSASAFDQSLGVNVHMGSTLGPYTNVALVESDLAYLGVANVRDALWGTSSQQQLAADGIKFDFIPPYTAAPGAPDTLNLPQFVSMLDAFVAAYPGSVSAIEGPNEVNDNPFTYAGGTTLADDAAFQQALYAAVRADPSLDGIPVYNLTLANTDPTQFAQLGNLSASANYANSRGYLIDDQPPGPNLSLILPFAQIDAPGLPEVITEAGYQTNPAATYSGVDQTVQAKLTLDELMDAFKDGISKTYLYELFDDGGSDFGLFNADGTPKLVATAIHNLTTILADPGSTSSFTPGTLSYAVPDLPAHGNQFLLEKSSGAFDLVLWAEAQIWNPTTESEIVAPTETAKVEFGQTEKVVLVFDPLQGATPIAVYSNTLSIQVSLSDHPIIIELPSATPTLATPAITGDGITNADVLTLTGTAVANSTVIVYDGTTQLGTATTDGNGAWSFVTGTLANGAHSLTALDTDAAGNISQSSAALQVPVGLLTVTQINDIYEAVLQRAPATAEVIASNALNATIGDAGVILELVDSPEAQQIVYPVIQIIQLALGNDPTAAQLQGWVHYVESGGSATATNVLEVQMATAFVASDNFGKFFNNGTDVNPNSLVTSTEMGLLIQAALGIPATQLQINAWVATGLTIDQVFVDFAIGDQYSAASKTAIQQYLTAAADNEATIPGTEANEALTLGTATPPLTQAGLTVLGGSGTFAVVASGAGDTITELNTSSAGGTITAEGAGDTINSANGANTITANGAGDLINLGVVSTGVSITVAQIVHAAGAGDTITFATTAADGTAVTWGSGASSAVDGGNSSLGIGANDTVNFGNNTGSGSEMVVITGDLTGATTSGGASTLGIAMTTLGKVVAGASDKIVFNNVTTETLAHSTGSNQVTVTSVTSLAQALDIAAASAAASQNSGTIAGHTGVIDWFQYAGNTYVVEAINVTSAAATHTALAATDEVVKIVGLVNLSGENFATHTLTL